MEHIKQAVERVKATGARLDSRDAADPIEPRRSFSPGAAAFTPPEARQIALDLDHLESKRIIAHDVLDRRTKPYEMLRTQVVRTMNAQKWQLIGITSPTPACGKTLTAINLAVSIARQPEKSVLLVDMDLQRPQVAAGLGLTCNEGILSVLEGRTAPAEAIVQAGIGDRQMLVLPCEASTSYSSEWMASSEMSGLIQQIRSDYSSHIVVLDLPPILASDDVISILPQLDCLLLVAAVGVSTVSDIEQCNKHLKSAEVVRVVLNKTADVSKGYYY